MSKKRWAIMLILILIISMLSGCGQSTSTVKEQNVLPFDNQKQESKTNQLKFVLLIADRRCHFNKTR